MVNFLSVISQHKHKSRYIFLLVLVLSVLFSKGQVYQLMPQYGYQAPRMSFDSTLQIPTFCGVPQLKSVQFATKKSAIAFDSCNNRFYTYNPKTQTWSQVSGGASGIDSLRRSTDSVFARKNGTFVFQYKDSIGGGSGSDTAKVVVAQVTNAEATTLQRGEVVYLYKATGNRASVKRANNLSDTTSSKTLGVVRDAITSGSVGYITTQGQCDKLNLGAFQEGDAVWLDSISGQFTKVKPQAPKHGVFVGIVERANNGNGVLYVKPQNGYELDEIHDVAIVLPQANDMLLYNSIYKVWQNVPYGINSLLTSGWQGINKSISLDTGVLYLRNNSRIDWEKGTKKRIDSITRTQYIDSTMRSSALEPHAVEIGKNSFGNYGITWETRDQYLFSGQKTIKKILRPSNFEQVYYDTIQTFLLPEIEGNDNQSTKTLAVKVNGQHANGYGNINLDLGDQTPRLIGKYHPVYCAECANPHWTLEWCQLFNNTGYTFTMEMKPAGYASIYETNNNNVFEENRTWIPPLGFAPDLNGDGIYGNGGVFAKNEVRFIVYQANGNTTTSHDWVSFEIRFYPTCTSGNVVDEQN